MQDYQRKVRSLMIGQAQESCASAFKRILSSLKLLFPCESSRPVLYDSALLAKEPHVMLSSLIPVSVQAIYVLLAYTRGSSKTHDLTRSRFHLLTWVMHSPAARLPAAMDV